MAERKTIPQLTVREVAEMLKRDPALKLYDVREDFEIQIASIPGAVHLTEQAANELIEKGDREALLIFSCHHGVRSLYAAAFFENQGFKNVASMAGGIDAWSKEIDPTIPTY